MLKSIKRTLEQMAENEEFMDAIREDLMYGQEMEGDDGEMVEEEDEQEESAEIVRGLHRVQDAG